MPLYVTVDSPINEKGNKNKREEEERKGNKKAKDEFKHGADVGGKAGS